MRPLLLSLIVALIMSASAYAAEPLMSAYSGILLKNSEVARAPSH